VNGLLALQASKTASSKAAADFAAFGELGFALLSGDEAEGSEAASGGGLAKTNRRQQ
jgi:hypothetical protein